VGTTIAASAPATAEVTAAAAKPAYAVVEATTTVAPMHAAAT
jgi:hypothetical protein